MLLTAPIGLVSPRVAHHIERALHDAARRATAEGVELPPEVADFLIDVRRLAEWHRAQRSGTYATTYAITDAADAADNMVGVGYVSEAAGISPHGVRDLARRGRLPGRQVDGHWTFDRSDVDEWLEKRAQEG